MKGERLMVVLADLPVEVSWDRGIVLEERVYVYGWIARADGRSDVLLVEASRITGEPTWWFTTSAKWSEAVCAHFNVAVGEPAEAHVPCVSFAEAIKALP